MAAGAVDLRQKNWIFGDNEFLTFDGPGNPAQATPAAAYQAVEGCATWSDDQGSLVIYTDGYRVFDARHNIVSTNVGGTQSTSRAVVMLPPIDGHIAHYHLFTLSDDDASNPTPDRIWHSTYDADANAATQVLPRVSLAPASNPAFDFTERQAATYNADCTGYWLVSQESGSNRFLAFPVNGDGRPGAPVITATGPVSSVRSAGCMAFSPDGQYLAWADSAQNLVSVERFDRSTGIVSHFAEYPGMRLTRFPQQSAGPYGVEFSFNGQNLFISCLQGDVFVTPLAAGTHGATALQTLFEVQQIFSGRQSGDLRRALNGRIYVAAGQAPYEILNPDDLTQVSLSRNTRDDLGQRLLDPWGFRTLGLPYFVEKPEDVMNIIHLSFEDGHEALPDQKNRTPAMPEHFIQTVGPVFLRFTAGHFRYRIRSAAIAFTVQGMNTPIPPAATLELEVYDFQGNLLRNLSTTPVSLGGTPVGTWVAPDLTADTTELTIEPGEIVAVKSNDIAGRGVVGSLLAELLP